MLIWKYVIQTNNGLIITKDVDFAEKKSRLGNTVFCKRESNLFRYNP